MKKFILTLCNTPEGLAVITLLTVVFVYLVIVRAFKAVSYYNDLEEPENESE